MEFIATVDTNHMKYKYTNGHERRNTYAGNDRSKNGRFKRAACSSVDRGKQQTTRLNFKMSVGIGRTSENKYQMILFELAL